MQFACSHVISLRPVSLLFSHVRLYLPNGAFSSGFPTKILYAFLITPVSATCLTHLVSDYVGYVFSWPFNRAFSDTKNTCSRLRRTEFDSSDLQQFDSIDLQQFDSNDL
jgi:hypothetical protein